MPQKVWRVGARMAAEKRRRDLVESAPWMNGGGLLESSGGTMDGQG